MEAVRRLADLGANVPRRMFSTNATPHRGELRTRGGGEAAGRARGEHRDSGRGVRRHASLHRGGLRTREGGEAAGKARGERRDAG